MEIKREKMVELLRILREDYAEQLSALPFKPQIRGALVDGFSDGARSGVKAALEMVGAKIVD